MAKLNRWLSAASSAGWAALVVCTPVVLAWPVVTQADDSFPISTYPMFSKLRGTPTVFQLRGDDGSLQLVRIGPELLGTSEVLQSKVLIASAVRRGPAARRRLCRKVARRAAVHPDYAQVRRIELVAARYDAIQYFTAAPTPLSVKRLTRCRVKPARRSREGGR